MYVYPITPAVQIRRRLAGWFGRREHFAGEFLGVVLIIESIVYRDWRLYVPCGIWIIYFISHRLEKKIYGKFGYR